MEVVSAVENTASVSQELECSSIQQLSSTVSSDPSQPLLTDLSRTCVEVDSNFMYTNDHDYCEKKVVFKAIYCVRKCSFLHVHYSF